MLQGCLLNGLLALLMLVMRLEHRLELPSVDHLLLLLLSTHHSTLLLLLGGNIIFRDMTLLSGFGLGAKLGIALG